MTDKEIMAQLADGGGLVPCSRYGWDSESCAPVALATVRIPEGETDEVATVETVDFVMSLVVNNHDDPEYLIRNYGAEYGYKWEDFE